MLDTTKEITVDMLIDALAALPKGTFATPEPQPGLFSIEPIREASTEEYWCRRCPLVVLADASLPERTGMISNAVEALRKVFGRWFTAEELDAIRAVMDGADRVNGHYRARLMEACY